jgi:hypothetical protein
MTTEFAPALPHGPIREVFPDVFVVRGSFRFAPLLTITRNMTILRSGSELTLVSSVRLTEEGERELEKLGKVKHLVKIGMFHGVDDPYYKARYSPTFWAPKGAPHAAGLKEDEELCVTAPLPFADAHLFRFESATKPEACIVLDPAGGREGGVLLSVDSVQNWKNLDGCSAMGKLMMRAMGFLAPAKIGGPWRKAMTPKGGPSLRADFDRLLAEPFEHLLSAHGDPLMKTAKADLRVQVEKTFA